MRGSRRLGCMFAAGLLLLSAGSKCRPESLWGLAKQNKKLLTVSTLFTAQNVRDYLGNEQGMKNALQWCRDTGVTHVFIETFRDNYTAERKVLENAKAKFEAEGFDVSGCVTTTRVGKISTGWKVISCYTNKETQE